MEGRIGVAQRRRGKRWEDCEWAEQGTKSSLTCELKGVMTITFSANGCFSPQDDGASPEFIPHPEAVLLYAKAQRPLQTSSLLRLPDHLLSRIALDLLDIPAKHETSTTSRADCISQECMNDILSLTRTCSALRAVHLPRDVWLRLTLDSVTRFRIALENRWRAKSNRCWVDRAAAYRPR